MADKTIDPVGEILLQVLVREDNGVPSRQSFAEARTALLAAIDGVRPEYTSHSCTDHRCAECKETEIIEKRDRQWHAAIHALFGEKS